MAQVIKLENGGYIKIDGEKFDEYKESNPKFNIEKIVMKKDMIL